MTKAYNNTRPKLSAYTSKKDRAGFWRFIFLLIATASFSLWWILMKMTDSTLYTQVTDLLQSNLPQFASEHYPYLLYAGGLATFLFLAFWAAIISHRGNIENQARV